MRFLGSVKDFPHLMAARLSQIDYHREMALVAVNALQEIVGVVRIIADPDNEAAEYAIMVRSDQKGKGLGYGMMVKILEYARAQGLKRIFGDVLRRTSPCCGWPRISASPCAPAAMTRRWCGWT